MPGTGKTYVITLLLRIMIERGDKIILSTYTHSAVDNILKRFIEKYPTMKDKIVRIASNASSVDEKLHDLIFQKKKFKSVREIKEFLEPKQIYAVTCLASTNALLGMMFFLLI